MIKVYEYSHLGGAEILQVRFPEINDAINAAIAAVQVPKKTKISKEKTKKRRLLYSPKEMNKRFKTEFNKAGFNELIDRYTIKIPKSALEIKGAYKQVDFAKDGVLAEVQFGKYAFMFYDLAKFQYFFNEAKAEVGVEIVPCHALKKQMSSGVSFGEQLVHDIERLRKHFPAVPVKVIVIDVEKRDDETRLALADEEWAESREDQEEPLR